MNRLQAAIHNMWTARKRIARALVLCYLKAGVNDMLVQEWADEWLSDTLNRLKRRILRR